MLIYDCEIIKAIPSKSVQPLHDIEYCNGWTDFQNMGISVVSICDLESDLEPEVYVFDSKERDAEIEKFNNAVCGSLISGFNSKKFDDLLMGANNIQIQTDLDILEAVLEAAGQKDRKYWNEGLKYNLASIVTANGMQKTGHGELAPILWQRGQRKEVIEYCRNDAMIERRVLQLLLAGELIDPNDGKKLKYSI